jgi:transposase
VQIENVSDMKTLKRFALMLEEENRRLIKLNRKLTDALRRAEGKEAQQLTLQIAELEAQLDKRNKMLFGDSTEKRPKAKAEASDEPKPQTGHGPRAQPNLRCVNEVHDLDAADKKCTACGGDLEEWSGQFEESEEIDVIRREFVVKTHRRKKYRCQCGGCIETAPAPVKLFSGARYSIDFGVATAIAKYSDHLPLERQVKMMRRDGLEIDSQTLWDQVNAVGKLLEPTYRALLTHVLSQPVIGADETHWRLMGGKKKRSGGAGKRWQVWTVCTSNAVAYQMKDSRSTEAARDVLGDFCGTAISDGYAAYANLAKERPGMKLAHCWAHARRKFVDIEASFPEPCREVLEMISELYAVERRCPTGPPGDGLRRELRETESRAIVDRIERWALEVRALPQGGLGKAIAYMAGIWKGLVLFLEDPAIPVDNNHTERAIRGIVIGRKNHYGSRSRRGTEVAAILYSLVESAKLAHVGPHTYMRAAIFAALNEREPLLPHQLA